MLKIHADLVQLHVPLHLIVHINHVCLDGTQLNLLVEMLVVVYVRLRLKLVIVLFKLFYVKMDIPYKMVYVLNAWLI